MTSPSPSIHYKNVCKDQDSFNEAFSDALDNYYKENRAPQNIMVIYLVIFIILLLWAIYLAMKIKPSPERVVHIFFALIASPIYILSFYLNTLK